MDGGQGDGAQTVGQGDEDTTTGVQIGTGAPNAMGVSCRLLLRQALNSPCRSPLFRAIEPDWQPVTKTASNPRITEFFISFFSPRPGNRSGRLFPPGRTGSLASSCHSIHAKNPPAVQFNLSKFGSTGQNGVGFLTVLPRNHDATVMPIFPKAHADHEQP